MAIRDTNSIPPQQKEAEEEHIPSTKKVHPLDRSNGTEDSSSKPLKKKIKRTTVEIHIPNTKEEQKQSNKIIIENTTETKKKDAAEFGRAGGVYLPPHKIRSLNRGTKHKINSPSYQRLVWHALRSSINGCINKADSSNMQEVVIDLFKENLIWGKGLFCRSVMKSQMAAPAYSNVFAALVGIINTKMPEIGELLVKRVVMQFQRAYRRNDKIVMNAIVVFFAHLVNNYIEDEIGALELLTLLLEKPTDDSVEVAIVFIKECGARLSELTPKGIYAIFETFRTIMNEGKVSTRVQYAIESLYSVYRDKFSDYPAIIPELDLVNEEDNIIHEIHIKEKYNIEPELDIFRPMSAEEFVEQQKLYDEIKNEILADSSDEEDDEDEEDQNEEEDQNDDDDDEEEEDQHEKTKKMEIIDKTGTEHTNLRRTIYLTIMSSLNFEEAAHKLLKIKIRPGEEPLVASMILDCCSNERTYHKDMGALGERFCRLSQKYADAFDELFGRQYTIIHRYETNKLRNISRFFAHLLSSDALEWDVLEYIKLTENDTTSSSRIFIKILFQELSVALGIKKLRERMEDESMKEAFSGVFPKDTPKNTRFAINFFTSIGLGGLTVSLRNHLEEVQKKIREDKTRVFESDSDSSSDESSSSDSDDDSDSSDDESSSDSDDDSDSSSSDESSSSSDSNSS